MDLRARLAVASVISAISMGVASAADISVISSTAMREVLEELIPAFERGSGHKVAITFQSGVNVSARMREGAVADVVITAALALDDLIKDGKVVAGSRVDFVGPLPSELQAVLVYVTGLPATAKQPELAKALVKFLTSEAALPVFKKLGMEPG